jgi:tetratricopeptide (TPR) repeat protein
VALDSGFSLPVAWRAGTHLMLAPNRDSLPAEVLAQVWEDVQRAEQLGGAEDEVAAARVVLRDQLDAGFAEDSLRRRYLLESTRFGRRLGRESPLAGAHRLLQEGRYDSAAVVFTAILEADPSMIPAWSGLEEAHLLQGHYAGAVDVREQRILATQGETPAAIASVEALHETFDESDPASYWLWRQDQSTGRVERGERVSDVELAVISVGLGDRGGALEHLEAAVDNRDPALVALRTSSMWDPLRSDPAFQEIVRRARELWRRGGAPRPDRGTPDRPEVSRTPRTPSAW